MAQPWTPPVGNTWNDVTLLNRIGLGRPLDFGEGDQNWDDGENAINWLGTTLLALIDSIELVAPTGDIKTSFVQTAPSGWLLCDGRTIGAAVSGATLTGNTYLPLYELLWNYATNSDLLSSGGGATTKGASAAADWAAPKRLILPDLRGRTIIGAGQGSGLTNRVIMSRTGVESYAIEHDHAINITSSLELGNYTPTGTITVDNALGMYTPTGTIAVDTALGPYTPTGTILVDNALSNYTPTGTISVDNALSAYTPTGSITVDDALGSYTPSGTVLVTLTNGALTGTGTINIDGETCTDVTGGAEVSVVACSSTFTVSATAIAAALATDVSVASQSFTGDAEDLEHTHTATFSGDAEDLTHNHVATFLGDTEDLEHTHTATFSGDAEDLEHVHAATFAGSTENLEHTHVSTFVGDVENLEHSHSVVGNTNTVTQTISTMQPSIAIYMYIKL